DALVQLRGWLARNGSDRGKKGESILPAPVVNQLARSRPRKLDELMAMTLTGFSELRKRTHGQNIIAVIDQARLQYMEAVTAGQEVANMSFMLLEEKLHHSGMGGGNAGLGGGGGGGGAKDGAGRREGGNVNQAKPALTPLTGPPPIHTHTPTHTHRHTHTDTHTDTHTHRHTHTHT
ncbi:hypothetical protein Vretimale_16084, partial [Volvox reticuliferus]